MDPDTALAKSHPIDADRAIGTGGDQQPASQRLCLGGLRIVDRIEGVAGQIRVVDDFPVADQASVIFSSDGNREIGDDVPLLVQHPQRELLHPDPDLCRVECRLGPRVHPGHPQCVADLEVVQRLTGIERLEKGWGTVEFLAQQLLNGLVGQARLGRLFLPAGGNDSDLVEVIGAQLIIGERLYPNLECGSLLGRQDSGCRVALGDLPLANALGRFPTVLPVDEARREVISIQCDLPPGNGDCAENSRLGNGLDRGCRGREGTRVSIRILGIQLGREEGDQGTTRRPC